MQATGCGTWVTLSLPNNVPKRGKRQAIGLGDVTCRLPSNKQR